MDLGQEHRFPEQIKVDYGSLLMMLLFQIFFCSFDLAIRSVWLLVRFRKYNLDEMVCLHEIELLMIGKTVTVSGMSL